MLLYKNILNKDRCGLLTRFTRMISVNLTNDNMHLFAGVCDKVTGLIMLKYLQSVYTASNLLREDHV